MDAYGKLNAGHQINHKKIRVHVIPGWIYGNILRNKLNVVDIEEYSKIRPFVSLDDLAQWHYLNSGFSIGKAGIQLATVDLFDSEKLSPVNQREYDITVRPLSGTDENIAAVAAKLSCSSNSIKLSGEASTHYDFVRTQNFLAVILYDGFIAEIQDSLKYKNFIDQYLEHCYVMASVDEVSQLAMFHEYLRLL